jgi:hypothetical protein
VQSSSSGGQQAIIAAGPIQGDLASLVHYGRSTIANAGQVGTLRMVSPRDVCLPQVSMRSIGVRVTQSSAGGSGAAGGVRHEDRCLAWAAAHMLLELPLPDWATGRRVLGVGAQTGRPVDDVGVLTDADGWVCIQAKKKLQRSELEKSDLAAALDQLVALLADGVPDRPPQQASMRPIDPQVDRVLILTDEEAPSTVRVAMAKLVDRLRTWPDGVPLDEAAATGPEREALRVLRLHLALLWRKRNGADPDEATLRSLVQPLAVQALDLRTDGADLRALLPGLRELLEEPDQAPALWRELERIGQRLAVERSWRRRADLVHELESLGIHLTAVTRLRPDVQRLQVLTAANLSSPPTRLTITTPDGPVAVSRTVSTHLAGSVGNVAITGDPGVGKSVVLHDFAAGETANAADVVYLIADQLRGTAGDTRLELNLRHDLGDVLSGWTGSRPGLLLLDGIDQTRGVDASSWLPGLAHCLHGTRWRIVASIRSFDLHNGPRWQTMFKGSPVDPGNADPGLSGLAHVVVGDLSSDEFATVATGSPVLEAVLQGADERLSALLANPFNLNLLGELIEADQDVDVSKISNRLDLLAAYWRLRVGSAHNHRTRRQVLRALVTTMVAGRTQQANDSCITDSGMLSVLDDLLHDGVIQERPGTRWSPSRPVGFSHPVLFDYAAAILALGDISEAESLAEALDADPDLAMVLRPSLDLRLAMAWHDDRSRTNYWRLGLRFSADGCGHMLAAAAAAHVAAHQLNNASDLKYLESACIERENAASWTVYDARGLAYLLATGLGRAPANPGAMDAFGELLVGLALRATNADDANLALVAAQLSLRAAGDHPPTSGTHAAQCWVQTALAAVVVGLANVDDPQRARLADIGGSALATAAILDTAAAAATIRAVIATRALRGWGVSAVRPLIEVMPRIAAQDAELAVDLGASVWLFEDDRSQPTAMLRSHILPLTSNRQQDLEGTRHQVGMKYPELAALDVAAATRLLVRIVEGRPSRRHHIEPRTDERPFVRYGDDLRYMGGHRVLLEMTNTLIDRLDELAQEGTGAVREAIKIISDELTHAEVWNRLLYRAAIAQSEALAAALRPILTSPALFAHSETWLAAGHLAARLSPTLPQLDHQPLERAILAATEPRAEDSESMRQRRGQRRDTLMSALESDRVSDPVAQAHLLEATTANRNVYPLEILQLDHDEMLLSVEPDSDASPEPPYADLVRELNEALEQTNRPDEREPARRRFLAAWPRLLAAQAGDPANEQIRSLILRSAGHIAHLAEVVPGTPIGDEIVATVRAALPETTRLQRGQRDNSSRTASWSETPETNALTAARALVARPEWRGASGDLRANLLSHLDSSRWVYRYLSTAAIGLLYTDEDELLSEVEFRLATEADQHIAANLVNAIAQYLHSRPSEVDQVFSRVASLRGSPHLFDPGNEDAGLHDTVAEGVVRCLTILAARYGTSFADVTVRAWLSKPIDHPATVTSIAFGLRDLLNPADSSLQDAQQKAYELLAITTAPLKAAWAAVTAAGGAPGVQTTARNAVTVADHVAQQVYFASGAFDERGVRTRQLGDPQVFSRLALPLLDGVSKVHHPMVTHLVVETAEYLSSAQPRPALLLALQAIMADAEYANEPLGLDAALKLITRYMADHRGVVLGDPECSAAVRTMLERFVRVGWPGAVQMAERMDEFFI